MARKSHRAWRQRYLWPHLPLQWFRVLRRLKGRPELSRKVLIFGQGRSGSTALQSCFPADEWTHMDEPLSIFWKPWAPEWLPEDAPGFVDKWAHGLDSRGGVVAHIKPEHLPEPQLWGPRLKRFHDLGWHIIHLERLDSFAQAMSVVRAQTSKRFNTENPEEAARWAADSAGLPEELLRAMIHRNEANLILNRRSVESSGAPFLRVTYEDLLGGDASKQQATLDQIQSLGPWRLTPPATHKVSPPVPTDSPIHRWYLRISEGIETEDSN